LLRGFTDEELARLLFDIDSAQKPNRFSPEQVVQFMQTVLPTLDSVKWIQRYAWFSAATGDIHLGTSALFYKDGSLTKVGQCYASM